MVRLDVPGPAVTTAEKDSARRKIDERVASAGPSASLSREPRIPDSKPPVQTFYIDDRGILWVAPALAAGQAHRFDVFDAEGRYLGAVQSPAIGSFPTPVFRGDALDGVVRDSMDVPFVVRWRIEGRQR